MEALYWAGVVTAAGLLAGAWFAPRRLAAVLIVLCAGICVTALVSLARAGVRR